MNIKKFQFVFFIVYFLFPYIVLAQGNTSIESFNKAKKILENEVYYDHRITLYCGYDFDEQNVMHPINQATFKRVFWNLFCAF